MMGETGTGLNLDAERADKIRKAWRDSGLGRLDRIWEGGDAFLDTASVCHSLYPR